jgi:DNA topoisomerase-2
MSSLPSRTAEDFFDTEYRNYAIYTIENRAIPSLVDGFKPAQRKIAFAANKLWKTGNEKPLKVFQLGGQAAALSFFHHGSLDGTIIGMAQDFKNSMPIFQGIGQFGSLRSPEAGAPRYVGVRFNENFRLLYKDFELVTPQFEEGEEIEPKFFLPIIPTVLLNGGSGIAVGFATNILNRHPLDLIDAVTEVLMTGATTQELRPWIHGFHGEVKPQLSSGGKSWTFSGVYSVKNSAQVEVTEIPPSFTYEKYEQHLESLVEKGVLHSYEDSSSDRVRYLLKFPRIKLSELLSEDKLEATLKMHEAATENITTLDETGKLKIFATPQEVVVYFTNIRLGYYGKRKAYILEQMSREIEVLEDRVKFLQAVVGGSLNVSNRPKKDLVADFEGLGLRKVDEGFDYLLSMPIYSLTAEKYLDLQNKLADKIKEKARVEATRPEDMYLQDLKDLRKKLSPKAAPQKSASNSTAPQSGLVQSWLGASKESSPKIEDALEFLSGLKE